MKKQLFIISIFALALLLSGACGKKSKKEEDKTEYLTYEEICELPVGSFGIACGEVYNNLEQYIDFFKERDYEYAPVIVRVKENKYFWRWEKDEDENALYPGSFKGYSQVSLVPEKTADGYDKLYEDDEIITQNRDYYFYIKDGGIWDELIRLINKNTGENIKDLEELYKHDTITIEMKPEKGVNYIQACMMGQYDFPLEEGALYTALLLKGKDGKKFCSLLLPVNNSGEAAVLLYEKYNVEKEDANLALEVSRLFD
ncbi:MAG: hypothetical protein IKR27_06380 [Lachnospiraceae bacterium]|nr:hypothetical protein [Lachnospiraceae bacterium]